MTRARSLARLARAIRAALALLVGACLLMGAAAPRPTAEEVPSLTLAEHDAGQALNAFAAGSSATGAVLFRFKLIAEADTQIDTLVVTVAASGLEAADLANLTLVADNNNNGFWDSGEPPVGTAEAPLDLADGRLAFHDVAALAGPQGRGYLLIAGTANLSPGDTLRLSLSANEMAVAEPLALTGEVSEVVHLVEPLAAVEPAPAKPQVAAASAIVINEVVTDPQHDWSGNGFNPSPGAGPVNDNDEWLELYNAGPDTIDLLTYSIDFNDTSPASFRFNARGDVTLNFSDGGTISVFQPGEYLTLGNPPESLNNAIYIVLRDGTGAVVDDVELGDDPEGDGPGDGAPDGNASGPLDEAVARVPNAGDTGNDPQDFIRQEARPGLDNGGSLTLGDHVSGQASNALLGGGPSAAAAVLFRFSLTAVGETAGLGSLTLNVTAAGLASTDLANLSLVYDANNNGLPDPGEPLVGTLETPLDLSDGLTFAGFTVPLGGAVRYLVQADVNNLAGGETLSLSLAAANLANVTGETTLKIIRPTGAASPAAHVAPAVPGLVVINEIVTDPQTDWSTHGFDGTPGAGPISEVDEYVELYIQASGLNLNGWTLDLLDSTPETGSLAAGGAFQVARYVGAGSFANTQPGDYLVLGNPRRSGLNNNLYLVLRDSTGVVVDEVEIGDDFEADGPGDGAPDGGNSSGNATGAASEAIARAPDGRDTGDDVRDFSQRAATPGAFNGGRLTLSESGGGQAANAFLPVSLTARTVEEADLFRFSLAAEGESVLVRRLHFGFLTYEFADDDFRDLRLIEDTNNNGLADPGEPAAGHLETPLKVSDGLTFTDVPVPQNANGTGYILRGTVAGVQRVRLLDVWLTSKQMASIGSSSGLVLAAEGEVSQLRHGEFFHTTDVRINEVVPHPGQDYNRNGTVNASGDEYIELINVGGRPIHIGGWLLDDIPAGGSAIYRFHLGTVIGPGKFLVLHRSATGLGLNDDSDFVQLRYPDGGLADEVMWDHDVGVDNSISRHSPGPGAFSFDWLPTPGMSNLARPTAVSNVPPLASLAEARTWGDGAYLTVEGWVTGPHPLFGSRTIYVQDGSGAGIVLYLGDGAYPAMQAGQQVRAYGYLRTITGERELYVKSLFQLNLGEPGSGPAPQPISTGTVGEATEGRLVTLRGKVVRLEENAFWLDDGSGPARIFFAATTGLDRPPVERGQTWQVTGLVGEFTTSVSTAPGYRVLPRFESDLVPLLEEAVSASIALPPLTAVVQPAQAAGLPPPAFRLTFPRAPLWRVLPGHRWWPR